MSLEGAHIRIAVDGAGTLDYDGPQRFKDLQRVARKLASGNGGAAIPVHPHGSNQRRYINPRYVREVWVIE